MKAVLMSIQPKWCELIANGKKTVEVRKTKPKLKTPFKVYIYCTKDEPLYKSGEKFWCEKAGEFGNGKVIGEFVCDETCDWYHHHITTLYGSKDGYFIFEDDLKASCLTYEDIVNYGTGKTVYGWHISDLVIYDKPKGLSEFKKTNRDCWYADLGLAKRDCPECKNEKCFMTRPPQSWCYVEELQASGL